MFLAQFTRIDLWHLSCSRFTWTKCHFLWSTITADMQCIVQHSSVQGRKHLSNRELRNLKALIKSIHRRQGLLLKIKEPIWVLVKACNPMSPALDLEHFARVGIDAGFFGLIFAAIRKVEFYYRETGDIWGCSLYTCQWKGKLQIVSSIYWLASLERGSFLYSLKRGNKSLQHIPEE